MSLSARLAVTIAALSGALVVGCDTHPPVAPTIDAFRTDMNLPDGGPGAPDMGHDAGPPVFPDTGIDAAADTSPGIDANIDMGTTPDIDMATDMDAGFDAGHDAFIAPDTNMDAGPMPDTSACLLPDGTFDLCNCGTFGDDCSTTACTNGETCVADACGHHCTPGGSACIDDVDCPASGSCMFGYCEHTTPCGDSRSCALGYACESGVCVDRRIPCSADANCPYGYACDQSIDRGTCIRLSRPCVTTAACNGTFGANQVCVDINGDGTRECQFAGGPCQRNVDCAASGVVCVPHALTDLSVCGRIGGPCNTVADCSPGDQCRDLWGDGIRECVAAGGCTNTASCPAHQVCATSVMVQGPPRCLAAGGD